MKDLQRFYFLKEISNHNIVALTSRCNCGCLFCSHGNNPKDANVYYCGDVPLEDVLSALDFIDPRETVVIGESASPLSEGEPLVYPHIFQVLRAIRERYPETPISLTTNGSLLTLKAVQELSKAQPLTVNLSLNTMGFRRELMGDKGNSAVEAPILLNRYSVPYNGSVVAMPEITGWDDIVATMEFLQKNGCSTLRLLMPGYSDLAPGERFYNWEERRKKCREIIKNIPGVNLLEPPYYRDNLPVIAGVVWGSAGDKCGFLKGDLILSVNGISPKNRHDAWQLLTENIDPKAVVKRNGEALTLNLTSPKGECGGLVFENDLDCRRLDEAAGIYKSKGGKAGICCSSLGQDYLRANLSLFPDLADLPLYVVENRYFGGNIGSAGLLTIDDFNSALSGLDLDYVFLPWEFLDYRGMDLTGKGPEDLIVKGHLI